MGVEALLISCKAAEFNKLDDVLLLAAVAAAERVSCPRKASSTDVVLWLIVPSTHTKAGQLVPLIGGHT